MRNPTDPEVAYAWHAKALIANGDRAKMPPIHENDPKPGWYMRRLVQKGPFVPARIWLEADVVNGELTGLERLLCEVDGKRREVGSEWTWLASRPITEDKYMEMLASNFTFTEQVTMTTVDVAITSEVADEPEAQIPPKTGETIF